ncbi:MAG: hypothetical protein P0116_16945, partial [Candidatus Nitrosocosmicus sp.]|nr:hypothetical protein [Candidatus Nitrosocosmicus sp.]
MNSNVFLVFTILPFLALSSIMIVGAQPLKPYPPDVSPFGKSYEEHATDYWRWLVSIPNDQAPFNDNTGDRCSNGQNNSSSPVFYLTGSGGDASKINRTCIVPEGKGIFIMAESSATSKTESPNSSNPELQEEVKNSVDLNEVINVTI